MRQRISTRKPFVWFWKKSGLEQCASLSGCRDSSPASPVIWSPSTSAGFRAEERGRNPRPTSPAPSQLDGLLREEKSSLVRRVLAGLSSDRDRKILYRFYLADDDKDEICADLGVTNLHFNQILCRGRERYKKLFEEMTMQPKKKISPGME